MCGCLESSQQNGSTMRGALVRRLNPGEATSASIAFQRYIRHRLVELLTPILTSILEDFLASILEDLHPSSAGCSHRTTEGGRTTLIPSQIYALLLLFLCTSCLPLRRSSRNGRRPWVMGSPVFPVVNIKEVEKTPLATFRRPSPTQICGRRQSPGQKARTGGFTAHISTLDQYIQFSRRSDVWSPGHLVRGSE